MPNEPNIFSQGPIAPLLLTVQEAAQVMRWSRTRTNAAIAAGTIDSYRDGKRRFVVAASLHAYVAERSTGTVQSPKPQTSRRRPASPIVRKAA